jgi:PAS domain S-box-containing protein
MDNFSMKTVLDSRCILVVEDDSGLQKLITKNLQKAGYTTRGVLSGKDAMEEIIRWRVEKPELVLLIDQNLPDMQGKEMITLLSEKGIKYPFVVMTGQGDERLAVDMMKLGADDYLVKDLGLIDRLDDVLKRIYNRLETERRLHSAEELLKTAEEEHRILLDNIQTQVWYLTTAFSYGAVNESHAAFIGASKDALAFKKRDELLPEYFIEAFWQDNEVIFRGGTISTEVWIPDSSGTNKCIFITKKPVFDANHHVSCAVCTAEDITDRKMAEEALLRSKEEIRIQQGKFQKDLLLSIIQILELYDMYTKGHSENVARYSALIAEKVNPDPVWIQQVYWAGLVHDIGKLLVPTQVLNKPTRLTDEEYELVKMHPVWGAKVLMTSERLLEIGQFVLHHHERFDGNGYPDKLSGDTIPIASRIIAVADAYDAMVSERSYRTPFPKEEAIQELLKNKGTQFDPRIIDVFIDAKNEILLIKNTINNGLFFSIENAFLK